MGLKNTNFRFFALAVEGKGISGGDRIFIEIARRWGKRYPVKVVTSYEGGRLCKKQDLRGKFLKISSIDNKIFEPIFFLNYLYKILAGIIVGFRLTINHQSSTIIYSASEFWMDAFPAFILKMRYSKIRWVAAWYQTAPKPWEGYAEGEREDKYNFSAFLYWLVQQPIKPLISHCADYVLVNNEEERKQFPALDKEGKVIVVLGAVNLDEIKKYQSSIVNHQPLKIYDAVFQGRFHPQKGVVELIDIWKKVVDKNPDAKLAMIGDGPLMKEVKRRITMNKLTKNVRLFGYLFDGPEKYKIFSQSKIVVHPAFYDSGGMASAEAMAFGLPAVGFDLSSFKSYYPKGMVKVEVGNLEEFADTIIELLNEKEYRGKIGKEALKMIQMNWSWNKRASDVLYEKILQS